MISFRTTLVLLSLCLAKTFIFSQDKFERWYDSAGETYLSTSLHTAGGGYIMLSVEIDDENRWPRFNVTNLSPKGNINWTNTYLYGDTTYITQIGEVIVTGDGGIAFSAVLDKDSLNKVVTKIDGNGNFLWSTVSGQIDDVSTTISDRSNLVNFNGDRIVHTNRTKGDDGRLDIFISSYHLDGRPDWINRMHPEDTLGNSLEGRVRDVIVTADSFLLLLGNTSSVDHQLFLVKIDTLGRVLWGKSFTGDFSLDHDESALSITEMPDSNLVILGAQAAGTTVGFVLVLDEFGNYLQSRTMKSNTSRFEIIPNNIVALADQNVIVSFKRVDLFTGEIRPMLIKYDLDSTTRFQTLLGQSSDLLITRSGLITADGETAAFLTSGYNSDTTWIVPHISKIGDDGETLCSEPFDGLTFDSVYFKTDTLIWNVEALTEFDTFPTLARPYAGFNPPILTLQDTLFCPQDPVRYIVDAAVEGGVAYLWDDNNTDSIRLFLEEGMFSVTVTVNEQGCFVLCDTVTITVQDEPVAQIFPNTVNFCSDGVIFLAVGSNNQITDIKWSTGDSTPIIAVTELKEYKVDIIDDCGNPANASIDLSDFTISVNPTLAIIDDNLCVNNTITITVTNQNIDPANLIWSTGVSGISGIVVNQPGIYTVRNEELFCPGESTIEIGEIFVRDPTAEIITSCLNNMFTLTVSGSDIVGQRWFDGTTGLSTSVSEEGTYTVEVFNICGDLAGASVDITAEDIRLCVNPPTGEACLKWPNIFVPKSREPLNQTFGPYDECGIVENYELRIFNRWGKNIFTTNNKDSRWDGTVGGSDAPGGVYFYYASYSDSTDEFKAEGDITLVR